MEILPGEISDPDWKGPRCRGCGRPVGEGFKSCSEYADEGLAPKAHLTIDAIKPEVRLRWFTSKVWSNALEMLGLLDAIAWMGAIHQSFNGQTPISMLRADKGMTVLELQHAEWPRLKLEADAVRNGMNVLRGVG